MCLFYKVCLDLFDFRNTYQFEVFMIKQHQAPRLIFSHASLLKYIHLKPIFLVSSALKPHHVFLIKVQVVETKDYSEMQERLDLVGDQRSRAREMVAQGQVRSGGAGAAVALGLGAGARGSMSAVRGRNVAGRSGWGKKSGLKNWWKKGNFSMVNVWKAYMEEWHSRKLLPCCMTTRHVTSYHLSLWQRKDKQVKLQQISSEPFKSGAGKFPGRGFRSKSCDGLRKEDPSRGGVRLKWWNVWGMLRKLLREIGSWSSICLCVYISLLVWKLLVGCGAIDGSKPTKYLAATSGNHPRNQRNGLHLPSLWWQFMKRSSLGSSFTLEKN